MKIHIHILLLTITFFIVGCFSTENNNHLKILDKFNLDIPEPSGLAISNDKKSLWTVSDNNSTVYQIDLKGIILQSFTVDAIDLEGIAIINDTLLCVISERSGEIIFVTTKGKEINRHVLDFSISPNNGLEGLAFDQMNKRYFVANEKNPRLLIELDSNLIVIKKTEIDFVDDVSGLDYDEIKNKLWLISDESKTVAKCTHEGILQTKYQVPIKQIEGIAVDSQSKKTYLVSDHEEKLYILQMDK